MVPEPDAINCTPVASTLNEKILDPNYKPSVDFKIKVQLAQNATELAKKYDPALEPLVRQDDHARPQRADYG